MNQEEDQKKKILIVEKSDFFIKYYLLGLSKGFEVAIIGSNKNIDPDIQDLNYDVFVLKFTAKDAFGGFRYRELVKKIREKHPKAKIIIAYSKEDAVGKDYCDIVSSKTNLPETIKKLF